LIIQRVDGVVNANLAAVATRRQRGNNARGGTDEANVFQLLAKANRVNVSLHLMSSKNCILTNNNLRFVSTKLSAKLFGADENWDSKHKSHCDSGDTG